MSSEEEKAALDVVSAVARFNELRLRSARKQLADLSSWYEAKIAERKALGKPTGDLWDRYLEVVAPLERRIEWLESL